MPHKVPHTVHVTKCCVIHSRARQRQENMQLPLKKPQRYQPSFAWSVSFPFWLKSSSCSKVALSKQRSSEVFSPLMAKRGQQVRFNLAAGGSCLHRGERRRSNLEKVTDGAAAEVIDEEPEEKFHQCHEQGV